MVQVQCKKSVITDRTHPVLMRPVLQKNYASQMLMFLVSLAWEEEVIASYQLPSVFDNFFLVPVFKLSSSEN